MKVGSFPNLRIGGNMKKSSYTKFVSAMYIVNLFAEATFALLTPIGLGVLLSWLLVKFATAPDWIYAILVTLGALTGLLSMTKFITSAMSSLDKLEAQHAEKRKPLNQNKPTNDKDKNEKN